MDPPPPAYESIEDDRRISLSSPRDSPRPSHISQPNTSSILPLTIPTRKYLLSSGFPYHSAIFALGISPDTWTQFSNEIVQATKLSVTQQSLAWTSGIGVGLVSVTVVPPFGAAAGVFAGKAVYDKSVLNNVRQGLEQGKLGDVLKRWNEQSWREKGIVVKLVVKQRKVQQKPDSPSPSQDTQKKENKRRLKISLKKEQQKDVSQGAGHFELVIESFNPNVSSADNSRATVIVRSTSESEDIHTNTVPVEMDDSVPIDQQQPAYELPIMSNADEKVGDSSSRSGSRPRPSELPQPIPELADEKAAQADITRLSWTSAHPSEIPQSPRDSIHDDAVQREAIGEDIERPVSGISRWSFEPRDDVQLSQDVEVSPIADAERRYFDHLHTPIDTSLAPAPLFAR